MKLLCTLLLFSVYLQTIGQNLKNTEWVKIKTERKDGSRIVDRKRIHTQSLKYFFQDSTIQIALNEQYNKLARYTVENGYLYITGKLGRPDVYKIDTVNNIVLSLTEIPQEQLTDDKINSSVFIKSRFLFEYLNETKQLSIIGDSLVQSDNLISPTYKGDLDKLFRDSLFDLINFIPNSGTTPNGTFEFYGQDKILKGSMVIPQNGRIQSTQIEPNKKFSKKELEKIQHCFNSINGEWAIPFTTAKPLSFKLDFALHFTSLAKSGNVYISFHDNDQNPINNIFLTYDEQTEANEHYSGGLKQLQKEKFDKAVNEFTKCIKIDSLQLDAYYNLAYSYSKLGNTKSACDTWHKLADLGQKKGELLYKENCK